ncbi:uncharacterized protein BYT42DRAFT_248838 [Radiomyces spectabilis]|uniref:uncharacterized protein n=1 Tax=Radiomyces spectabilis TaxID=64574 RepID=UPI00222021C4|nr:uncharacterized protein BYT42DRAFT_248838 [Radiomyces spectabilis]KAI8388842.1 hypothetical protein BYT42DRAFT_248838 [Radiomyces spectabilis]
MTLSIHPLAQEEQPPMSFSTNPHPYMTSSIPSSPHTTNIESQSPTSPSFYAAQSPESPQPRPAYHQQRAYSVTAMPSDLQKTVQQYQQRKLEEQHLLQQESVKQPWWQYYYQLYHYHLPPGRKPTVFGPYLLLHTLGEGEFGKVKLAVHIETGHEVAIKLMKKDHIDSSVRMTKVEKEISVLKTVCHPYIVKLYDVIETEKYIGIILQCASGGELFEYILAHKYLKEKDACRFFAQLISGVYYMHQKHIVHRDLKLENLLLDRHRNIIITDFGFANQFSSAKDDLMSTSCGSPCYAAPELVISEGLYVGSAVDIWSCGVILYAMLCGYLPFDDDPANPESVNINLLYKYILNTPLTFPDHISDEARDLLSRMLVPDPIKRCSVQTIMDHPWLRPHRSLFAKSVHELEMEAMRSSDIPLHTMLSRRRQQQLQHQPSLSSNPPHHAKKAISTGTGNQVLYTQPDASQSRTIKEDHSCTKENSADISDDTVSVKENNKDRREPDGKTVDAVHEDSIQKEDPTNLQREDEGVAHPETSPGNDLENIGTSADPEQPSSTKTTQDASSPSPKPAFASSPSDVQNVSSSSPASVSENVDKDTNSQETVKRKSIIDAPKEDVMVTTTSDTVTPQPTPSESKRGPSTDRILNFLSGSMSTPRQVASRNAKSGAATAHKEGKASTTDASAPTSGSILQAKFFSSMQRRREHGSPSNISPAGHQSSMSTHVVSPLPTKIPTSARFPPVSGPSEGMPHPVRGTRRKALSLLVNSVTDHLGQDDKRHSMRKPPTSAARKSTHESTSGVKVIVTETPPLTPKTPVEMMPSVSEHTLTSTTDKDKHRSAGKKLIDWFKKKPMSTRDRSLNRATQGDFLSTDHVPGTLHTPQRVTPLGKPLGSYAVDFNDSKLRMHRGAVDQDALTSRPPQEIFNELRHMLQTMGIDVKRNGEYRLKCTRRERMASVTDESKKRKSSSDMSFRNFLRRTSAGPATLPAIDNAKQPMYGDPVVDPGDEVRFTIELCKIKNLPGLYSVDIRRLHGNAWAYKFLYHAVLDTLNLSGKGGYMSTHVPPPSNNGLSANMQNGRQADKESPSSSNRISVVSSAGSSNLLEDVKEEAAENA